MEGVAVGGYHDGEVPCRACVLVVRARLLRGGDDDGGDFDDGSFSARDIRDRRRTGLGHPGQAGAADEAAGDEEREPEEPRRRRPVFAPQCPPRRACIISRCNLGFVEYEEGNVELAVQH